MVSLLCPIIRTSEIVNLALVTSPIWLIGSLIDL